MGCDVLCVLSGLAIGGGPEFVMVPADVEGVARAITADCARHGHVSLPGPRAPTTVDRLGVPEAAEEQPGRVGGASALPGDAASGSDEENRDWLSAALGVAAMAVGEFRFIRNLLRQQFGDQGALAEWEFFRSIVLVGHHYDWDDDTSGGETDEQRRATTGRDVECAIFHDARRLRGGVSVEVSRRMALDDIDENDSADRSDTELYLICDHTYSDLAPSYGNFFALEGPFRYFRAWIDRDSLPPRSVAFPADPQPMSFAGELFEILGSRSTIRCK